MRFYSEMWDFIRNMRFYSWNPSILTPMIINIQSNMISVNREEHRLKDWWDTHTLWINWMRYGIFWFGGMWDFIHDVRFYSEMQDFSRENPQSWLIITKHNEKMYTDPLYNSSSNNQIHFERYPCPKILQIYCFLDDYGIIVYLKCEILFKIITYIQDLIIIFGLLDLNT